MSSVDSGAFRHFLPRRRRTRAPRWNPEADQSGLVQTRHKRQNMKEAEFVHFVSGGGGGGGGTFRPASADQSAAARG